MTFELDTSGATQSSGNGGGSNIDFEAMNQEVVDAAGTQKKPKTLVGFISGLYDLGMQPRPDFEKIHDPNDTKEVEALEKGEATLETKNFYDNGKWYNDAEVFCKPRTPAKAIAFAVDFPSIVVDKGKHFGESNPLPLRLVMGNTWAVTNPDNPEKKMPIIASPFFLAENTNNNVGKWALSNRSNLHKMGEAADLLTDDGLFVKENISGLLGKALMFKIQVFMNDKGYYTEKINFVSEVPEGLPVPEFDTSLIHGLNMNRPNDPDALGQVRAVVKNTMRLSADWDDSVIRQELEELYQSRRAAKADKPEQKEDKQPEPEQEEEWDENDAPF